MTLCGNLIGSSANSGGLQCSQCKYIVLHDIEVTYVANCVNIYDGHLNNPGHFRGVTDNGLNFDDGALYANALASHHLVFDNIYIHNIGSGLCDALES
jgi:hypothetical protein